MVGTVGHMQPPEFTAGEAQARVHGGTRKGPGVRVDPTPASAPLRLPHGHRGCRCAVLLTPGRGQKGSAPVCIPEATCRPLMPGSGGRARLARDSTRQHRSRGQP